MVREIKIELETINYITNNLKLLPKELQIEPNPMNEITYRNWFYSVCNFIEKERKDMDKIFKELVDKTRHYSWIERIDKKVNIIEIKINFYNKDVFSLSILCMTNGNYLFFVDDIFYMSRKQFNIERVIKQIIKIIKIRNCDLIETYKEIGVDLINY